MFKKNLLFPGGLESKSSELKKVRKLARLTNEKKEGKRSGLLRRLSFLFFSSSVSVETSDRLSQMERESKSCTKKCFAPNPTKAGRWRHFADANNFYGLVREKKNIDATAL